MGKGTEKIKSALADCPAYAILDSSTLDACDPNDWLAAVLGAGVKVLQLRMKAAPPAEVEKIARLMVGAASEHGALVIINDFMTVALNAGADGVHLGNADSPIEDARESALMDSRPDFIIGGSARTVELAREVEKAGADYIGTGSCFPTGTKPDAEIIGIEGLRRIVRSVNNPVIGIGGVGWENFRQVLDAGAKGFAAVEMWNIPPAKIARLASLHLECGD